MEDKGAYVFIGKFKWIFIAIVVILIITIIGASVYNYLKVKNVNTNLKENGFTENTKNIYSKSITEGDKTISYLYISDEDEFTKNISLQNKQISETTDFSYKNGKIEVSYNYFDGKNGSISQRATYNNDDDYSCTIIKKDGDCKSKCATLLDEIKSFKIEAEKYVKKMNS